jgi:hypothetical protein
MKIWERKKVGVQPMLRKKLVAFLGMCAFLVTVPMTASALVIDFNSTGDIGPLLGSDSFILEMQINLAVGENPTVFSYSLACTGCIVTHYTDYQAQPAYFPTAVDWTGAAGNVDFADSLFGNDFGISPTATPGAIVGPVGTLKLGGAAFTGSGNTMKVGYLTVHVTAASGGVVGFFDPSTDGMFCNGPQCTWQDSGTFGSVSWVPEPGTAMLLALGLGGLGVMGRRGRN